MRSPRDRLNNALLTLNFLMSMRQVAELLGGGGGLALSFPPLFFNSRVCSSLLSVVINIMTQINFGEEKFFLVCR